MRAPCCRQGCPVRATAAAKEKSAEPAGLQPSWAVQGCCLHLYIPQMHPFSVSRRAQEDRIQSFDRQTMREACQALRNTEVVASRETGLVLSHRTRGMLRLSWGPLGQLSVTWPHNGLQSPLTSRLLPAMTFSVLQGAQEDSQFQSNRSRQWRVTPCPIPEGGHCLLARGFESSKPFL